ncbi:AFG1/ZapE family ATPase [Brucella abortus]|nr:AFG1/ZapE family ATPase [Brucella abortus]
MISADAHQSRFHWNLSCLFDGNLKAFPSVRERYEAMVAAGDVGDRPRPAELTSRYDRLIGEICSKRLSRKSSALGWLFGKRRKRPRPSRALSSTVRWGAAKTMLMDMFFQLLPVERKRRAHFNDFMADVHERIYAHRQAHKRGETKQDDQSRRWRRR